MTRPTRRKKNMNTTKSFLSALGLLAPLCAIASAQVSINELRIDETGTDTEEYFELTGAPGTPLAGLTYVVIGDTPGGGAIEEAEDLSAFVINPSGFFLGVNTTYLGICGGALPDGTFSLAFENSDNVTHMVVSGFTGAIGLDLDTNDDGTIDVPLPWTSIVDSIALVEHPDGTQSGGERVYDFGFPTVGPDGAFGPGHAFRCGDWRIGGFAVCTNDTPGIANDCSFPSAFCVGDTATPELCPCGNSGSAGAGCDIKQTTGGVALSVANFAPDGFGGGSADFNMTGFRLDTEPSGVLIRSTTRTRLTVFGDGLLCLDSPVVRINSTFAVAGSASILGQGHGAGAGAFSYQYWFRALPAAWCTPDGFNVSNGVQLDW